MSISLPFPFDLYLVRLLPLLSVSNLHQKLAVTLPIHSQPKCSTNVINSKSRSKDKQFKEVGWREIFKPRTLLGSLRWWRADAGTLLALMDSEHLFCLLSRQSLALAALDAQASVLSGISFVFQKLLFDLYLWRKRKQYTYSFPFGTVSFQSLTSVPLPKLSLQPAESQQRPIQVIDNTGRQLKLFFNIFWEWKCQVIYFSEHMQLKKNQCFPNWGTKRTSNKDKWQFHLNSC